MEKYARISSINSRAAQNTPEFVRMAESNYAAYIEEAAQMIASSPDKPVVLLSGPSGSGKTTTALRIEKTLREQGAKVHTISMDNYFLPITPESEKELPRDENGQIDLESPHRLDIPLFSEHLKLLADGVPFEVPIFDFATQSRSGSIPMRRERGEIVIIEGIHALNPEVTGDTHEFARCIYVSVRTRLRSDDGTLLHPRQIRLMRRLCRDRIFRNRSYHKIFNMFKSVSRGEDLYILPHKHRADYDIDTFMAYEPSVYKHFIDFTQAAGESEALDEFEAYSQIVKFLGELDEIDIKHVPSTSLIREFVGGSELNY